VKRALTANWPWKLLSLGIAFVLWAVLGRQSEMAMTISAPVQYRNIADDVDISSEIPDHVHLEVRGPADRLTESYLSTASVALDFGHFTSPGERTFNIDGHNVKLPLGIVFARAVPSQIRVRFDRRITRDIPVRPRFYGTPPDGYRLAQIHLEPQSIRIRGPESHVAHLDSVQTDPIDLSGIVGEHAGRVPTYIGDPQVQVVGQGTVDYKLTMTKGGR